MCPLPVWFTVHLEPRQKALGLGHIAALCLSRGRSARPKGEGWQPEQWLPPNMSRGSTKVYSHEGLFSWRWSRFCEDGWERLGRYKAGLFCLLRESM